MLLLLTPNRGGRFESQLLFLMEEAIHCHQAILEFLKLYSSIMKLIN